MNPFLHDVLHYTYFFAQMVKDPDVIGQMTNAWQKFIETGQVWAMLIGMFLGYVFAIVERHSFRYICRTYLIMDLIVRKV